MRTTCFFFLMFGIFLFTLKKKKHPTRESSMGAALDPWRAKSLKAPMRHCAPTVLHLESSSILTRTRVRYQCPSHGSAGRPTPPLASEPQLDRKKMIAQLECQEYFLVIFLVVGSNLRLILPSVCSAFLLACNYHFWSSLICRSMIIHGRLPLL